MYSKLTSKGVKVPNGFAITATRIGIFCARMGWIKNKKHLQNLDITDVRELARVGKIIRDSVLAVEFPADLKRNYFILSRVIVIGKNKNLSVAVRSSAMPRTCRTRVSRPARNIFECPRKRSC